MYLLRTRWDIKYIMADPPPRIHIASEENIGHINALVVGSSVTPYEGGLLRFHIACPNEYPIESPRVHFLTTDAGLVQLNSNLYPNGESLLTYDPFYEPYVTKEMHQEAVNKYEVFVHHDVVRVAVCNAVESCLEDNSSHPAVLREKVLELFLEFYDR
ncbi:ubiquitin-conjugating enzyme E2 Z-like [Dermacentor andersoni]|uniref:ubiquitin-conjugating enzyme E2 Z-like n=1 Tax=Dermacentor andersoni TaxID=34620 RepID=UPI002417EAF6|nr:ubiquitin-conjugating enzyme E2 Z-like [Dermacentor andersoni]